VAVASRLHPTCNTSSSDRPDPARSSGRSSASYINWENLHNMSPKTGMFGLHSPSHAIVSHY
jgi:hypothetical protein